MINRAIKRIEQSTLTLARKFHVSYMTVHGRLNENEVKYRKRKRIQKYTKTQLEKLSRIFQIKKDEIYF